MDDDSRILNEEVTSVDNISREETDGEKLDVTAETLEDTGIVMVDETTSVLLTETLVEETT